MVEKDFQEKIYAYALDNAFTHEGRAQEGAVLSHLFKDGLKKEQIKEIMPFIKETVKKVNSLSKKELEEAFNNYRVEFEKLREIKKEKKKELMELPNPTKNMVFRLAPYPSGALHIGNAKTYMLNALYAEKYNGKILFVLDDTIGSEKKQLIKEAYTLIPESFDWLNVKYEKPIIYKSDRLEIYYKYAEEIIKKGRAYVCSCSSEVLRENRKNGVECSCRNLSVEEQLKRWKEMFKAKEGKFALRIKTDMKHPNPAFRDRVLFRISEREHVRVGKKYRVWPMLEFSWAVDDHLLGITHIIRGKDLMIESDMEREIWNIFGWKHPEINHGGMIKIEGIEGASMHKSKAQQEVKSGKFTGWDDPRTWSVQSLKRRGFKPESIREFIKEIGLNENDITVPIDSLYAINRKIIDADANRYSFVANPVKIKVDGMPKLGSIDVQIHPEKKELKKIKISPKGEFYISKEDFKEHKGKDIRLLNLFNIKLKEKSKMLEDSTDKSLQKLNWVSDNFKVKARVLMVDGKWTEGFAEENIKKLKVDDLIQFERFGFCRFDKFDKKTKTYEFWFSHK